MKKRFIFLAAFLLLLIVPTIVSSAKIDAGIIEKLNDKQEVSVIVILKEGLAAQKGLSALNKADANQIFEQKKAMVRTQQDKVLSKLNLKSTGNLIKSADAKGRVSISSDIDFSLRHKYSTVNGFSGTITEQGLEKLMNDPDVKEIYLGKLVHATLDQSIPQINADNVWQIQLGSINITGLDETICIVDTGIDYNHPSLGEGWGNKIIGGYNEITLQDCSVNNSACLDDNGHGTHCAGIAASENGIYKGVAPDAKLVAIKVLDSDGEGWDADIIAGIDWCVNNAPQFNISVISMSLGAEGTYYNENCDSDFPLESDAINNAVGVGISVIIASGNDYPPVGISVPACIENATPVGSVNEGDTIGFQRGNILDLLAPGYNIYSTLQNNNWGSKSGTSMSAPHVAGAAALLKQFVRLYNGTDITPQEIEDVLNATGKEIDDISGSGRNYSRIDVYSAMLSLDIDNRLTIQADNTAPVIIANVTSPATVYTNIDWMLNLTVIDPDAGDTITAYTQFYVNGTSFGAEFSLVVSNNTNTNVANLSSSELGKGAILIAEFWAGDETDNTTKTNTTQVTVLENYNITNCTELQAMNNNLSADYILVNDIDCSDTINWNSGEGFKPIGNYSPTQYNFSGTLDGQGHKITGIYINRSSNYQGLFGYITSIAEIKNITLENSMIRGYTVVGGLVGYNENGTITNSYSISDVTGLGDVGGLVGYNSGIITNSYSISNVTGSSVGTGGMVGANAGIITNSYSISNVTGSGWYPGGLVGYNSGTITNSYYDYNNSKINGENAISIGALYESQFNEWLNNNKSFDIDEYLTKDGNYYQINNVSDFKQLLAFSQNDSLKFKLNDNLNLKNESDFYIPYFAGEFDGNQKIISNLNINISFLSRIGLFGQTTSTANISNIGVENSVIYGYVYLGGLVGYNYGNIYNSYSISNVTGSDYFIGGLVGYNRFGTITNSYSISNVTGLSDVGGLIGHNYYGDISNCYTGGNIYTGGESGQYHGGFIGYNNQGKINNSYSTAYVESTHSDSGGFVGSINMAGDYSDTNNFWDNETSNKSTTMGNATGKTTVEMKNISTFNDTSIVGLEQPWDIVLYENYVSETWYINNENDYPRLSWEHDNTEPIITSILSSSVTSSSATLTATTDENATCAYSANDINYTNMTAFTTTGTINHSVALSGLSASTSYTYYVRCNDTAGNVMNFSNSTTFTTSAASPISSGGGGGGGSSVSYEQKSLGTLAAGSSKKITFLESDTHGITEIEVKVKNKVTNAKIKVDVDSLPSGVSLPSTKGSVYKYIEITKVDLTDDDIKNAVINFKVNKEWLTNKNYGIDTVSLHRYYNKKWEKLETTRTGFSSEYYYYSAESTGFSTFAITAEKAPPAPTTIKVTEKIAEEEPEEKIAEEEPESLSEEESIFSRLRFNLKDIKFNINWVWTTIIVITLSVIYFAQKKWNVLKISVGMESEAIIIITTKMKKTEKLIEEGNVDSAKKTYKKILKIYDGLPVNEKKWVYKEIQSLYSKIKNKGS